MGLACRLGTDPVKNTIFIFFILFLVGGIYNIFAAAIFKQWSDLSIFLDRQGCLCYFSAFILLEYWVKYECVPCERDFCSLCFVL